MNMRTIQEIDADLEQAYEAESEAYWAIQVVDDKKKVAAADEAWQVAWIRVEALEEERAMLKAREVKP
jgi:hypothetical protein